MWIGDRVYFLSDRNGPVTLFSYDVKSKKITQAIENRGLDIKSASGRPGPSCTSVRVAESLRSENGQGAEGGDRAQRRSARACGRAWKRPPSRYGRFSLSPTGVRRCSRRGARSSRYRPRKGDAAQSDAVARRGGPRAGLVSGREVDRLLSPTSRASTCCICASRAAWAK